MAPISGDTYATLQQGQNLSLSDLGLSADSVTVEIEYDSPTTSQGLSDMVIILVGPGGKRSSAEDVVDGRRTSSGIDGVVLHGRVTGRSEDRPGTVDSATFNLDKARPDVSRVVIGIRPETSLPSPVAHPNRCRILLKQHPDAWPLAIFPIDHTDASSAELALELYRRNGEWRVRAIGHNYGNGLFGLLSDFGGSLADLDVRVDGPRPAAGGPPEAEQLGAEDGQPTGPNCQGDVVGRIHLPPDPGLVESLGTHHSMESALADLVDNCIDADATTVRIRFETTGTRLVRISVIDDGHGMDDTMVNHAMTIGRRRPYAPGSLGNFGLGLKSSALSLGDILSVWSVARDATPVGRRLRKSSMISDFSCEVLSDVACAEAAVARRETVGGTTGTSVVLDDLRSSYRGTSKSEAQTWLSAVMEAVKIHLGVVFHRLIEASRIRLELEQCTADSTGRTMPMPILAINPFVYKASGYPGYPRNLTANLGSDSVTFQCHIWPAKSNVTGFRLGTRSGEAFQGFYVYRADRLLQLGGWNDTTTAQSDRQLARVVLEDESTVGRLLTMNPEKRGIRFEPALMDAIGAAKSSDGTTTFDSYLSNAVDAFRAGRLTSRTRRPTIRPDKGFAPKLRQSIGAELDFIDTRDPLEIRWKILPDGEFVEVDLPNRTVWLNAAYRDVLVPSHRGLNDAPLIKALVYLLMRDVFDGDYLGPRDRDNVMLWRSILGAAAQEESALRRSE